MADEALDCRRIFSLLSDYLDAELTPQTCDEIRRHIEGCEPCVAFVESLRRSIELCREFPQAAPGPIDPASRDRLRAAFESTGPADSPN
jgi:anti-sigma factor RsiW